MLKSNPVSIILLIYAFPVIYYSLLLIILLIFLLIYDYLIIFYILVFDFYFFTLKFSLFYNFDLINNK
jgi:hypothetical protein